jgi:transcriptional regulator with XRE-family HTH domain
MISSIGTRIASIIVDADIKKIQFAHILNIDQSYVSRLINGKGIPSERLIEDICQKFNINKAWIYDGVGAMHLQQNREAEILSWAEKVAHDTGDSFPKRLALALSRLGKNDWIVLEHLATSLLAESDESSLIDTHASTTTPSTEDEINAEAERYKAELKAQAKDVSVSDGGVNTKKMA